MDLSGDDATTGEECGEARAPVITAAFFVDFWGTTEFTEEDDHGFVEESAFGEVIEESGDGLIQWRQEAIFECLKDAAVIIPVLYGPHIGLDDWNTGFDQAAGKEQGLTECMSAVAVADAVGFTVEFKGLGEFSGGKHSEGEALVFGESSGGRVIGERGGVIEGVEERAALVESAEVDSLSEGEGINAEVFAVGVTDDLPRVVFGTEESGMLSGPCERRGHEKCRQIHAAGDAIRAGSEEFAAGGIAGPIIAGGDFVEESTWLKVTGEDMVSGHQVIVITMTECSD